MGRPALPEVRALKVSGERIVTRQGGFNPTWQRHTANYLFAVEFLAGSPGHRVLDLGCGTGHAAHLLGDRWSVGLDFNHASLVEQERPTVRADLRRVPFRDGAYDAVLCLHAIEHVPDPDRVASECARLVAPGGRAVIATPNRLTFGRPDEIIDPYHDIEFDPDQLRAVCRPYFTSVEVFGLFGSPRYMEFFQRERRKLDTLLRLDFLRLRRIVPRKLRRRLYDVALTRGRRSEDALASSIELEDFSVKDTDLETALDLFAVCTAPAG